jgi:hypothetical protein
MFGAMAVVGSGRARGEGREGAHARRGTGAGWRFFFGLGISNARTHNQSPEL